jgi:hypothetical protein
MLIIWLSIVTIWFITFRVLRRAQRRERVIPLDHLPVTFLLVAVLYLTLPPLFWMLQGGVYVSPLEGRLFSWQPTLEEQRYLTLLGLMVVAGLGFSQLLIRRVRIRGAREMTPVPFAVALVCLGLVTLNFVLVSGLETAGVIRSADGYGDSYLAIQQLPLFLRQILKILGGLSLFAQLTAMVWLFQHWRSLKLWAYALVLFAVVSVRPEGGRAAVAIMLFATVILWNRFVRPFTLSQMALVGVLGVAAFTALGAVRAIANSTLELGVFEVGLGEFDVLWGNAVELYRENRDGRLNLPVSLYFSEFYGPIPSNILPFEKMSYATWYLDVYYPEYKLTGGGNMFGLLAQLAVGWGLIEAFIRGLVLGLFLGWLTRYLGRGTQWWRYPVLLYCAVWSFLAIRDSSFALITPLVQIVVIGVIAFKVAAAIQATLRRLVPRRTALKPG